MDRLEAEIRRIERALLWGKDIMNDPGFEVYVAEELDLRKFAFFKKTRAYIGTYFLSEFRKPEGAFGYRYEKNIKTGEVRIELTDNVSMRKKILEFDGKQGFTISEEYIAYSL